MQSTRQTSVVNAPRPVFPDAMVQKGTAGNITVQLTMVGIHVLTLSATDSDGNQDVDSVTITLEP